MLGSEEEVPAFPGLPDVEEESHEDKHALQGRRGSSGAMEMLEGSRSAPLGRGSRNAEEFEPLVVGESELSGSAGY